MTKISRIDIDKLTDNSDLIDNNNDNDRFDVTTYVNELQKTKSEDGDVHFDKESLLRENLPSNFDVSVSINTTNDEDDINLLNADFEATRIINKFQVEMLMESAKVAYAQYNKSGSAKDLDNVVKIMYALDVAKKSLIGASNDKYKAEKNKGSIGGITTAKTVNIQNNTFTGTPADMLNMHGNAIDQKEWGDGESGKG